MSQYGQFKKISEKILWYSVGWDDYCFSWPKKKMEWDYIIVQTGLYPAILGKGSWPILGRIIDLMSKL